MEITIPALNAAADAQTLNTLKLHSGPVGANGTSNQIAGASVAATYAAASNGYRDLASAVDVPITKAAPEDPDITVSHFSVWNGATFIFGDVLDTAPETYANDGTARVNSARLTFAKGE